MPLTRRDFIARSGLSGLGLTLGLSGAACRNRRPEPTAERNAASKAPPTPRLRPAVTDATTPAESGFPYIDASGTPADIGHAVGRATASRIRRTIDGQRAWFDRLCSFARADPASRMTPYVQAIERHHPEIMAELRGLARGAELPEQDLIIWNIQPELSAMMSAERRSGCSTLHLATDERAFLAHNEDGHSVYRDQMVLLRLRPEGRPAITCLAYPGLIPGQVPAINSEGLLLSTNYIATREVRPGLPRYVLGRAALSASSIDEAVATATNPDRAFAFTMHLGSLRERRLSCLEIAPRAHALHDVSGVFAHTNHLVLPELAAVAQELSDSTTSRYEILTRAIGELPALEQVDGAELVRLLASHEAVHEPYSPCRHPEGGTRSRTLATALFDVTGGTFTLFEGNPCENRQRTVELAG